MGFINKQNLTRHTFIHTEPSHECDICNYKVGNRETLQRHVKQKHTDSPAVIHRCKDCGKILSSERVLRHHMKTIHTKGLLVPTCPECTKTFSSESSVRRHFANAHQNL